MSIEADLKKDGITVIEPLDNSSVISIAKNVSEKIFLTFPSYGFSSKDLFNRFSSVSMYIANIPEGMSEASYFYKNSSIYFRDGMGLSDLEKFSVHELIHNLQEKKDSNGNLIRLGLCEYKGSKAFGTALNEGAVQIISSNVLNSTFENVEYYGLTFSTISSTVYPIICNLVTQMAYITGEDTLYDSTFNSNNKFKNKFTALCGEKIYNNIVTNLDKIMDTEEKLIVLNNTLMNTDLSFSKLEKLKNNIDTLKLNIKKLYFNTQELIITSYFSTIFSSLLTTVDIEHFRKNLYNFQELTGTCTNYYFFNNYYIEMMEKLDKKYDVITGSTYLIPKKENKLLKFISFIKKILLKKEFETELKNK